MQAIRPLHDAIERGNAICQPNPEQIVTAIMDFEDALAQPHYSCLIRWRFAVFDADRPPCMSAIFDPGLNPALYQRSRDIVWQIHAHRARRTWLYHHPFMPYEGTHCVPERGNDTDVLAVFVADVTPNGQTPTSSATQSGATETTRFKPIGLLKFSWAAMAGRLCD